jgi:chitinase
LICSYYKKILFVSLIAISSTFAQKKEIVAYYGGYRHNNQATLLKEIDRKGSAEKLTVINYFFAVPQPDSSGNIVLRFNSYSAYQEMYSKEMSIDGIADLPDQPLRGNFNQLRKLKKKYPHIKVLLSIGGWGGSQYFSDLALTKESREKFINSCIDLFADGNLPVESNADMPAGGKSSAKGVFDGFDLDWEFPISGGPEGTHYHPNDRENHTALFADFRKQLDEINPELLLTAAVSARTWEFWKYNFKKDQEYLDWFNVMTYDYHGIWDLITGHHTNLLSSPLDPDIGKESLDRTVKYLLDSAGVESSKIVPGAAFYGKGWIEVSDENNGLYQPAKNDTTRFRIRFNNYLDSSDVKEKGFNIFWDEMAMAPWLYNSESKRFITYDDFRSVALKAQYVDAYNLRGLMFWELNGDDTLGTMVKIIHDSNIPDVETYDDNANNILPEVSILDQENFDNILKGSNLIIKAKASDEDGRVIKVDFFVDNKSIGYNIKAPFSWVWFNVTQGDHIIKVVATDNCGGVSISDSVEVKVIGN